MKSALEEKEVYSSLFDGGDILSIHIVGEPKPADIFREVNIMLNTYKIPFFSLNFERGKELKLDKFME